MGVAGAALGTLIGELVAVLAGLALFARHYGGVRALMARIVPGELREGAALRRLVGLNRDLMIRSMALMGAYGWFAAQGSRMGEVALSANAILLNLLMIVGFFQDGIAQAAEQLSGKALGANWRPAFEQAYRLSFAWGLGISVALALAWYFGGDALISVMTTNDEVRRFANDYLWVAALCALTFMPAFVFDGILIGLTQNAMMRNGMLFSLAVFLAAASCCRAVRQSRAVAGAAPVVHRARRLLRLALGRRQACYLRDAQAAVALPTSAAILALPAARTLAARPRLMRSSRSKPPNTSAE